jgi:predicted membrane protein
MYGKTARLVFLLAAGVLALVIMLYPVALSKDGATPPHELLALVMLCISAGFIHGVGFTPTAALWLYLFHPFLGWLLMAVGLLLILSR